MFLLFLPRQHVETLKEAKMRDGNLCLQTRLQGKICGFHLIRAESTYMLAGGFYCFCLFQLQQNKKATASSRSSDQQTIYFLTIKLIISPSLRVSIYNMFNIRSIHRNHRSHRNYFFQVPESHLQSNY